MPSFTVPKTITTYVVKRGQPVEKYTGYKKTAEYSANEQMGLCDCIGFNYRDHCKHLLFKSLLEHFKVDEFVFFGEEFGECKPRMKDEMLELGDQLKGILQRHFMYNSLELARLIQNPVDERLFNCIEYDGLRDRNVLVLGYAHGVMLIIRPKKQGEPACEPAKLDF